MTMRKTAVMRSSTVRTQAGGDGISWGVEDVELLLFLVTLFEPGFTATGKVGGERETSTGLDRSLRGRVLVRMRRRWVGTLYVQVSELVTVRRASTVTQNAMVASKAVMSRKGFVILSASVLANEDPEPERYRDDGGQIQCFPWGGNFEWKVAIDDGKRLVSKVESGARRRAFIIEVQAERAFFFPSRGMGCVT